jgi:hypothetical protein
MRHTHILALLTLVLVGGLGSGCAGTWDALTGGDGPAKQYRPLGVAASQPVAARWSALQALARRDGWRIEGQDAGRGTLDAVRAEDRSSGVRERVRVRLGAVETEVSVLSEMWIDDSWRSTAEVCESYGYTREVEVAMALEGPRSRVAPAERRPEGASLSYAAFGPGQRDE